MASTWATPQSHQGVTSQTLRVRPILLASSSQQPKLICTVNQIWRYFSLRLDFESISRAAHSCQLDVRYDSHCHALAKSFLSTVASYAILDKTPLQVTPSQVIVLISPQKIAAPKWTW